MEATADSVARPRPAWRVAWRRLMPTLALSAFFSLPLSVTSPTPLWTWLLRGMTVGLCCLVAYSLLQRWPVRLPRWFGRWALQLLGVVGVVPFAALLAYAWTSGGDPELATWRGRLPGMAGLFFAGVLFAPWVALAAMVRQREAFAREQALGFELERSELARQALDARLRLLQAQVEPHFLFNTLANVRELVDSGSPQASRVLDSLIAYLRAAVPRINEAASTIVQELQLVRAYLELMQMRMPDRLQYALHADAAAAPLRCPPTTLLTLVENAVRHGIDPAEDGGRIDVRVWLADGRCVAQVLDSGVGLQGRSRVNLNGRSGGLGTGLSSLRERLQLAFGGDASLRLSDNAPRGVRAEVEFPAEPVAVAASTARTA